MTQEQRGLVTLIAVASLGVCLVIIVGGFMVALIRLQDGEAGKLLQDTLAQLLWPLVAGLAALAGIPNLVKGITPADGVPPQAPPPVDPTPPSEGV